MPDSKFNAEFRVTERDWLKVQLDLYSLKTRGTEHAVFFEVKWNEVVCHIHTTSLDAWRRNNMAKEKREELFLNWASSERKALSEILNQLPTLSKLFDLDKNLTVMINDDYGKGAATVCTIRGNQIVSHFFEGDFIAP